MSISPVSGSPVLPVVVPRPPDEVKKTSSAQAPASGSRPAVARVVRPVSKSVQADDANKIEENLVASKSSSQGVKNRYNQQMVAALESTKGQYIDLLA